MAAAGWVEQASKIEVQNRPKLLRHAQEVVKFAQHPHRILQIAGQLVLLLAEGPWGTSSSWGIAGSNSSLPLALARVWRVVAIIAAADHGYQITV